jgi:signal transduction histidine kinase
MRTGPVQPIRSAPPPSPWHAWLRLRWLLGGAIGLAFALGQLLELWFLGPWASPERIVLDVLGWGLLGGLAVWLSLTWASRQEQQYHAGLGAALHEQQLLNRQLQRANSYLALLSDVNRHIAESATLDQIFGAALDFPRRLIPSRAAALVLNDGTGAVDVHSAGASADEFDQWRRALRIEQLLLDDDHPRVVVAPADLQRTVAACVVVPLRDGSAALGRIELYATHAAPIPPDELALLQTISSEIAEAIVGARRRSQAERAMYELERAIADERARIARDIHDGIAQTLAFRRMRIDLWLDWLDTDRERLRDELIENKQILREQIGELRRAIFALRPVQFDELGFVGGLHRYVVEFANQHGWDAHVDLQAVPPTLTPPVEAICFRVVQESLTNVAKHAQATRVDVVLDTVANGLRIVVRDNGVGFDLERGAEPSTHLGLRQMRERVAAARGQLTLSSQAGAGTEVRAWIPFTDTTAWSTT